MKSWIAVAVASALSWGAVTEATAQEETTIRVGFGPISKYPDEFGGGGCKANYAGISAGIGQALSDLLTLEADVTWTGSLATRCESAAAALSRPTPPDGTIYGRTVIDEVLLGETFAATRIGAVLTPWRAATIAPAFRIAGGRLWSKDLWTWTAGVGLKYGFGAHAVVVDVERWNLGYDAVQESWIRSESGPDALVSRETVRITRAPWFLRLGWEFAIRGR